MVGGVAGLLVTMTCFVLDKFGDDLDSYAITMIAMLGGLGAMLPRSPTWGWMHHFKVLMEPPTIFWDNNKSGNVELKVAYEYTGNEPSKAQAAFTAGRSEASAADHTWTWDNDAGTAVQGAPPHAAANWVDRNGFLKKLLPRTFAPTQEEDLKFTNRCRATMIELRQYYVR